MRILEDEDILERFKRGAISDRRFIESMRNLPEEPEAQEGKPEDTRLTEILTIMTEILKEIKAPKLIPILGVQKKRELIVHRDENGLIQSITFEEAENGE